MGRLMLKSKIWQGVGFLLVLVASFMVLGGRTYAGQDSVTDPDIIGADSILMEISKYRVDGTYTNTLEAPIAYAKLSFSNPDKSTHRFRIEPCNVFRDKNCDPTRMESEMQVTLCGYQADGTYAVDACLASPGQTINQPWLNYDTDIPAGAKNSVVPDANGKYTYIVRITFNGGSYQPSFFPVHAFRVRALDGGRAGYPANNNPLEAGYTQPLAVQQRDASKNYTNTNWVDTIRVRFRVNCDTAKNTGFQLKWFDADGANDGIPANYGSGKDIHFTLSQYHQGDQFPSQTIDSRALNIAMGGNNAPGSYNITGNFGTFAEIRPGDFFVWSWNEVLANNGLQVYMPYDDYAVNEDCPDNPVYTPTGQTRCEDRRLRGRIDDPDKPSDAILYRIYRDAFPGFGGTKIAEGYADINGHDFNVDISAYTNQKRNYYIFALDIDSNGNNTGKWVNVGSVNDVGPCGPVAELDCTLSTSPSKPEPGQPFSLSITYNYPSAVTVGGTVKIDPGSILSSLVAFPANKTTGTVTYDNLSGPAGKYTATATLVANPGAVSVTCKEDIQIGNKSYVKVYGQDVAAGGAFSSQASCSPTNDTASIITYSRSINPWNGSVDQPEQWAGSSTQFASFALGKNYNFFTAGQHSPRHNTAGTTQTTPVTDLAFGNYDPNNRIGTQPGANSPRAQAILDGSKVPDYGGNGGLYRCVPDYYSKKPAQQNGGDGTYSVSSLGDGSYFYNGNVTLTSLPNYSGHKAIFVKGDVTISSNIQFNNGWVNEAEIPSLWIIASGNIKISSNVNRVDGIYVAQPTSSGGGKIYTCTEANGNTFNASDLYARCGSKLTIGGAFIAEQVKFLRTFQTLQSSQPNEAANATNAAEVFVGGAELYLGRPPASLQVGGGCTNSNCAYDAITSLPPTL